MMNLKRHFPQASITLLAFFCCCYANAFSIMSYNVENLFDTKHDPGHQDWTYLPLEEKENNKDVIRYCASQYIPIYKNECYNLDWSTETYEAKVDNIVNVIESYNKENGPDIVVLEEVENIDVLNKIAKKLGPTYISSVLLQGDDTRGINIGMISRFPITSSKLISIDLSEEGANHKTRGILQVSFKVKQQIVTVFGNHFPSQGNSSSMRAIAAQTLLDAVENLPTNQSRAVIAVGDFNTLPKDSPNAINDYILTQFTDSEQAAREQGATPGEGSHFYRKKWSSLDHIFIIKNTTLRPNFSSFKFHKTSSSVNDDGQPIRFDPVNLTGSSDHLPVVMEIE